MIRNTLSLTITFTGFLGLREATKMGKINFNHQGLTRTHPVQKFISIHLRAF